MADQKSRRSGPVRKDHGEGRGFVCSKKGCDKSANEVVKLLLFCEGFDEPAEVFATIFACSEEHQAPYGDIRQFFEHNWEILATGFEIRQLPRPILEKTLMAWTSVEDYEEYLRQRDGDDPSSRKVVTIQ